MRKIGETLVYSPSDLIHFMENEFITWMDRYRLECPGEAFPDDDSEEAQIFQRLGHEHEERVLRRFREERQDVVEIESDEASFERTAEAMSRGAAVIYQAALRNGLFAGYSDFLMRIDHLSNFGSYSYEVWDTKLARK